MLIRAGKLPFILIEHVKDSVFYRRTLQIFVQGSRRDICDLIEYQNRIETKNNCKKANVRGYHLLLGG